jgi:hypothetical protein
MRRWRQSASGESAIVAGYSFEGLLDDRRNIGYMALKDVLLASANGTDFPIGDNETIP